MEYDRTVTVPWAAFDPVTVTLVDYDWVNEDVCSWKSTTATSIGLLDGRTPDAATFREGWDVRKVPDAFANFRLLGPTSQSEAEFRRDLQAFYRYVSPGAGWSAVGAER